MNSHVTGTSALGRTFWDNMTVPTRRITPGLWPGGQTYRHIPYAAASPAQWLNQEIRRRTRVVGSFSDENSVLIL